MTNGGPLQRRSVLTRLAGVIAGVSGPGCQRRETDPLTIEEVAPSDPTPSPAPDHEVELAGWPVAAGRLLAVIGDLVDNHDKLNGPVVDRPADDRRRGFRARLGDRLARFTPPSVFVGSAGAAIWPYAHAEHLHAIGDLVEMRTNEQLFPVATEAMDIDGTTYALPITMWPVDRWCCRAELLGETDLDPMGLRSPGDLIDAIERIEERTDATGVAVPATASALLALVMDCLPPAERPMAGTPNVPESARRTATQHVATVLADVDRLVTDPSGAAAAVRAGRAAIARATTRFLCQIGQETPLEVFRFPQRTADRRVDILAAGYPKRNPTPVATELLLQALQQPDVAGRIAGIPGLWPVRSASGTSGEGMPVERGRLRPAPSTGCGLPADPHWRVLDRLGRLDPPVTADALFAATDPLTA